MFINILYFRLLGVILLLTLFTTEGFTANIYKKVDSLLQIIRKDGSDIYDQLTQLEVITKSIRKEQPEVALKLLDAGINMANKAQVDTTHAYFYYLKGRIEKRIGAPEKAANSYEKAKVLYKGLNNQKGICNTINELGWLEVRKGNYQKARILFQEALSMATSADLPLIIAVQLNDIGVTYHYQKAYQKATENYLKAARIRENEGHKAGLVISYNNLGSIYKLNKDDENAIKYYKKGLEIAEERNDLRRIISLNINLGNLSVQNHRYEEAIAHYQTALSTAETYKSRSQIALCNFKLGRIYAKKYEFQKAINFYKKSISTYNELQEKSNLGATLFELGRVNYIQGKKKKGLDLMEKGLDLGKQTNAISIDNYKVLAGIYKEVGRTLEAYELLASYSNIKDSIESRSLKENIAGLQIEFEAEFKAKEQAQEIVLLTQGQIYQQNRFRLVLIFLGIIFASVLALIWNLIQKTKLNKLLKKQRKELLTINAAKQEAVIKAEKAAKAKSEFLSSMSHEIRTPMNAVVGITNLLIDESPRKDQIENLETLKFSSSNLLGIINDILDFSKIESGNIVLEKTDFSLETLLRNIIETFILTTKNRDVKIGLSGDLTSLKRYLNGDPTRLTQIFTNLLGNAVKFTNAGSITLHVEILGITKNDTTIRFEVRDTGIGISDDKLETIFDSFTQAADDTTRLYGGTGLGLTITKNLVELQGGKIQVKSKKGEGSTFFFILTFQLGKVINQVNKGKLSSAIAAKTGLEGCSILLAEDNKINQLVAKKILTKWKIKLDIANDGVEVLEKVAQKDYDLILMDIQMPRMNGFEATEKIRALNSPKNEVPIIALTASAFHIISDNSTPEEFKINDYVCKPFEPNHLYDKIYNCIKEARENTNSAKVVTA